MSTWDRIDEEIENYKNEVQKRSRRVPFDFRLRPGQQAKFVILSDNVFLRYEHPYAIPPKKQYGSLPCVTEGNNYQCPLCQYVTMNPKGIFGPRTLYGYLSAVLLDEVTDSKGNVIRNPMRAVVMKRSTLEALRLIRETSDNDLTGLTIVARRTNESKAPAVGDVWIPGKRLSPEEIKELNPDAKPYDWEATLPIFSADELEMKITAMTGQSPKAMSPTQYEDPNVIPGW